MATAKLSLAAWQPCSLHIACARCAGHFVPTLLVHDLLGMAALWAQVTLPVLILSAWCGAVSIAQPAVPPLSCRYLGCTVDQLWHPAHAPPRLEAVRGLGHRPRPHPLPGLPAAARHPQLPGPPWPHQEGSPGGWRTCSAAVCLAYAGPPAMRCIVYDERKSHLCIL